MPTETRLAEIARLRSEKRALKDALRDGASIVRRLQRHHENAWDCEGSFNRCDDLNSEASEFVRAHGSMSGRPASGVSRPPTVA